MTQPIVGIRYVGKKDRQEDTVCKTGAVWLPGQTHNFAGDLANRLLVHTDSFEQAPLSMEGNTFLSAGNKAKPQDAAAFVNLTGMDSDQLALFARMNFNSIVNTEGKDEAQVRREVHALMTNHNLDAEAERRKEEPREDGKTLVHYAATKEEYEALMAGTVVLAIVPAELVAAQGVVEATDDESKTPTLSELLASLEKPELIEMAEKYGVEVDKRLGADKIREVIFSALAERASE